MGTPSYKPARNLIQAALRIWRLNRRCVICGMALTAQTGKIKTSEHIPPEGVYVGALASDLLTVPCCESCNNGTSATDLAFQCCLALYCEKISPNQTYWSNQKYTKLRRFYFGHDDKNMPNTLKAKFKQHFETGEVVNPMFWWPWSDHDPVIQKIVAGLYWLYHGGDIFADKNFDVIIVRGMDFSKSHASSMSAESFLGVNVANWQFAAKHVQSFDQNSPLFGVFCLQLHFLSKRKSNKGYHVLVLCYPKAASSSHQSTGGWVSAMLQMPTAKTKARKYEVLGGIWRDIES